MCVVHEVKVRSLYLSDIVAAYRCFLCWFIAIIIYTERNKSSTLDFDIDLDVIFIELGPSLVELLA